MSSVEVTGSLQDCMFPTLVASYKPKRKKAGQTVIAHISDLHFDADTDFTRQPWDSLLSDLTHKDRGGIDLLAVTGDLIDSPITGMVSKWIPERFRENQTKRAFVNVCNFLERVCLRLDINPEQGLVVVPGNHDYRLAGIHRSKTQPQQFHDHFKTFCRPLVLPSLKTCVFVLDSNVMEFLDLAAARINSGDLIRLNDLALRLPSECSTFTKIVLLHHHPMPIAATERPGLIHNPGFTLLKNAGQFMTAMVASRIDLILHGHEHYAAYSKAIFPYDKAQDHLMTVISAGSVGKNVETYNLITIHDDGQIDLERRSLGNRVLYGVEYAKQLRSYEDARQVAFHRHAAAIAKLRIDKSSRLCVIKSGSGDADLFERSENVRAYGNEIKESTSRLKSQAGFFFTPTFDNPTTRWEWVKNESLDPITRQGKVVFDPPLTKDSPITFSSFSKNYNLFQFNKQDQLDFTDGKLNKEYYSVTIFHAIDVFALTIRFPRNNFPKKFDYIVVDRNGEPDKSEREYFIKHLTVFREDCSVVLTIEKPLPGFKYQIWWELPEMEEDELELTSVERAQADELVRKLLHPDSNHSTNSDLPYWIQLVRQNITSSNMWKELSGNDDLEISFYVYDRSQRGLACVAYSTEDGSLTSPWSAVIKPGETCIGEAYRRRGVAFYNPLSSSVFDQREYDARIPVDWRAVKTKRYLALCAIPVFYPLLGGRRIGVLTMASRSNQSRLLSFVPDKNDNKDVAEQKRIRQASLIENLTGNQFKALIERLGVRVAAYSASAGRNA